MTAIRHIPGQVTTLCSSSLLEIFDESYLSAFGEPLSSEAHELRSGSYYLELYAANRGEELRFLEFVGSQPGMIAASLNYVGFSLTDRFIEEPPYEFQHPPGLGVERDIQYFLSLDGNILCHPYEEFRQLLLDTRPAHLTAAIDVAPEHCRQVMTLIAEGFERGSRDNQGYTGPLVTIGLTSNIDNSTITDLHGYCDRLLLLASLAESVDTQVASINMSVDFAQIIRGYNDLDPANMESPDSVLSIPMLQKTLSLVLSNLSTTDPLGGEPRSPALFAAAGNRLAPGDLPRVRLGYPAIRPETIAATFVTKLGAEGDSDPVESVDIPATTGLKPCFAIDIDAMRPSRCDGSSFASAWLAGYYSAWCIAGEPVGGFGPFGKVAWIMERTRRSRLPGGRLRLPCFVGVIGRAAAESRDGWDLDELIDDLRTEFEADFCLHGSTSAVAEWLRLQGRHLEELEPWVHKDLGDVDLLFAGRIKRSDEDEEDDPDTAADKAKRFVRAWFERRLGRAWVRDRKRPVELHHYEGAIKATERLRSVTPVSKLYITQGGLIDTWGGLEDLKRRGIRFLPLTHPGFWARNASFRTGADSLGLNILEWISVATLLRLVSGALKVTPPIPEQESVAKVEQILREAEKGGGAVRLFGYGRGDRRERLDRRFERVETLMGSCARRGLIDPTLDHILKWLHRLRPCLDRPPVGPAGA